MWTLLAGLAAGTLHVLTGPDHLAALAPLAVQRPRQAAGLGLYWGLGHGSGVLALGGLGILARGLIDVQAISAWSEGMVGLLLVGIGLWALHRARGLTVHTHVHHHENTGHRGEGHVHVHADGLPHDDPAAHRRHSHAAASVGLLHGMAGSGHLFGVLPSLALEPGPALGYLGAYVASAVACMVLVGMGLGSVAGRGGPRLVRGAMMFTGVAAVGIGAVWLARL